MLHDTACIKHLNNGPVINTKIRHSASYYVNDMQWQIQGREIRGGASPANIGSPSLNGSGDATVVPSIPTCTK